MKVELRYLGRSGIHPAADGLTMSLAPNLARGRVFFDGEVRDPAAYREAMSALHSVVVSDLRFVKRSGSAAYKEFAKRRAEEDAAAFRGAQRERYAEEKAKKPPKASKELEANHERLRKKYWRARDAFDAEIARSNPALFRALMPLDPVITVAPDVVFFEGFAKDESQYGCLLVDRDAFRGGDGDALGTTNVDYSMGLYEHLQTLRSYRPTRLVVDPSGFDVVVEGRGDHREEQIDLPASWLRGFSQVTAAMSLPNRVVLLDVPAVYAIVSYLVRHREKRGPRSLTFHLRPGHPPAITLEPFGLEVASNGPKYDGPKEERIRVWGRRRLASLARVLPLAEFVEVRLLGDGLPSIWTAHLGPMRFILGLSGWTKSDWSSGAALDLLSNTHAAKPELTAKLAGRLEAEKKASLADLVAFTQRSREEVQASLQTLARQGQLVHDFAHELYRWRPILPIALTPKLLGTDHPELEGARAIVAERRVTVLRDEIATGLRILVGRAGDQPHVELAVNADGVTQRGRCSCSWFFRNKLRQGPCRHILALRMSA